MAFIISLFALAVAAFAPTASIAAAKPKVSLVRLPEGAIQPQAAIDERGIIHVVYFTGTPGSGDLNYAQLKGETFTSPIRVNSIPGSAIAAGSVRGAQLTLGRAGRVHVTWNGANPLEVEGVKRTPMWYARLASNGKVFEPQRDVSIVMLHIDGGGAIAADRRGTVTVLWHAQGAEPGEANRTVYLAESTDDGVTFAAARPVTSGTGSCACCGMRALARAEGGIDILYRVATNGEQRDTTWLQFSPGAPSASSVRVHEWQLRQCPMTTFALAALGNKDVLAAWETQQQIYLATLSPKAGTFSSPVPMSGSGTSRKHPSVAVNASGIRLVAWTEGTAWSRGGRVAWEAFGADGKSIASGNDAGPVPVWGLVAAVTRPDGAFVVLH